MDDRVAKNRGLSPMERALLRFEPAFLRSLGIEPPPNCRPKKNNPFKSSEVQRMDHQHRWFVTMTESGKPDANASQRYCVGCGVYESLPSATVPDNDNRNQVDG